MTTRRVRWRYRLLIVFVVLVGLPFYWLLVDQHVGEVPRVRFDLAEMRRLAEQVPGDKPHRVQVQDVASRRVPGTLLVAGGGMRLNTVTVQSFLASAGTSGDIVIDSGLSAQDARALGFSRYSPRDQSRIEAAMRRAGLILFTHEHLDHVGGFLRSPAFASIAGKALITPEQLAGIRATRGLTWSPAAEASIRPFAYRRMAAVAPGVVLIKTPGHTAGSQMIFVRLANGHEYLFAGDTATMGRSWRWERARSRLLADYVAPENRAAILGWLRALAELKRQAPSLIIVPGHDLEEITTPLAHSGVRRGFPAASDGQGSAAND